MKNLTGAGLTTKRTKFTKGRSSRCFAVFAVFGVAAPVRGSAAQRFVRRQIDS